MDTDQLINISKILGRNFLEELGKEINDGVENNSTEV